MGHLFCLNKVLCYLFQSTELASKVSHQFSLPRNLQSSCNLLSAIVHVLQCSGNHIHMIISVYTARNAQSYKIQSSESILTGYGVTICQHISNFASSNASF